MAVNINIPSQVTQEITEGVTSTAPSEDAVFNALASKANSADLALVATSGDYNDLVNQPSIPSIAGLVPDTRNLTINGTTYDLSADRTWTIAATASLLQHEVKAGEILTKGQAVYVSSADGTNMIVTKASNATEATSSKTMGLIAQNLANNGKGYVITEGLLSGLNTAAAVDGDPVWLGTGGNLIYGLINKPAAPAHLVFIGIVTRANVSNGEIFVRVQNGFELQELHNVSITSVADDNLLQYDSATSLWKNESLATAGIQPTLTSGTNIKTINGTSVLGSGDITVGGGIAVGTTAVTSGTIGRVFFQATGNVVQQSASLFWDNTNGRLNLGAVGTNSARLDIKAPGALSTDIAFRVRNSADTQNMISIAGDGRMAIGLNAQILGTTDAFKNVVIGGGAKDIAAAGVTENAVAFGYNAVSNNGGTAIGANTSITGIQGVAIGAGAIAGYQSLAIGTSARADGTSGYQSLAIGFGARASALLSGIIAVGQSSYTNALGQTLAFCVDPSGANSQTMLLTNKANLVFRNSTQLTSGTHWNTTATNTLTIHNGTIPDTTIANAGQLYVEGGALKFRGGSGTITVVAPA